MYNLIQNNFFHLKKNIFCDLLYIFSKYRKQLFRFTQKVAFDIFNSRGNFLNDTHRIPLK